MFPPRIDPRTLQDLIKQMQEMVPHYTPEWRFSPNDPDPGTALFMIFAQQFLQNIDRLNRVPMKNQIAFLNLLDVSQLHAQAAHAYVTFRLNPGTPDPVLVKAGTQLMAEAADGGEHLLFETDTPLLATPVPFSEAYAVSNYRDAIVRLTEGLCVTAPDEARGIPLFEFTAGENLQEHCLYLGHDELFLVEEQADLEIELIHSGARYKANTYGEMLADTGRFEWSYSTEDGWQAFDEVGAMDNKVLLSKSKRVPIQPCVVNGKSKRWIRCRLVPQQSDLLASGILPQVDRLLAKTEHRASHKQGGIQPQLLFFNDVPLEPAGCYPFGEFFPPYAAFYLHNQEVLSKKQARVTLQFALKQIKNRLINEEPPPVQWKLLMDDREMDKTERQPVLDTSILHVQWEYWNGESWARLFEGQDAEHSQTYETLFYRLGEAEQEVTIEFECPEAMQETAVNGHYGYWIRARVLQIENMYANNPHYLSPWLENIRFQYGYDGRHLPLEACLTHNNAEWTEHGMGPGEGVFRLFDGVDHRYPAFYMGFDSAPVRGPLGIFFSVQPQTHTGNTRPIVTWEYLRQHGEHTEWAALEAIDETQGLVQSGLLRFAGPSDFARASRFQQDKYWIRAVNRDGKWDRSRDEQPLPVIRGVYLNTVRVTQWESIENESPKMRTVDGETEYLLAKAPLHSEEIWVDETGFLAEGDLSSLQEADSKRVKVMRDSFGDILKIWVRWQAVDHLDESGLEDRHYLINRSSGVLRFGDGTHGKVPPNQGGESILVHYKRTEGGRGNVQAGQIKNMRKNIPFVKSVFNPHPAGGGCDDEPLRATLERGPQMIKHRNRAVTAGDYEWLVRQANQDIARVKCLANTNALLEKESGSVTVVLFPRQGQEGMHVFPELKKQVEEYLIERSAHTTAFGGQVHVVPPALLEVSVYAHLYAEDMDVVVQVEQDVLERLNAFLDPLTGNYDGKGWMIGQPMRSTMLYALLKSVPGIHHVEKLAISVVKWENGVRQEITLEQFTSIMHGLVVNGRHRVVVDPMRKS